MLLPPKIIHFIASSIWPVNRPKALFLPILIPPVKPITIRINLDTFPMSFPISKMPLYSRLPTLSNLPPKHHIILVKITFPYISLLTDIGAFAMFLAQ